MAVIRPSFKSKPAKIKQILLICKPRLCQCKFMQKIAIFAKSAIFSQKPLYLDDASHTIFAKMQKLHFYKNRVTCIVQIKRFLRKNRTFFQILGKI